MWLYSCECLQSMRICCKIHLHPLLLIRVCFDFAYICVDYVEFKHTNLDKMLASPTVGAFWAQLLYVAAYKAMQKKENKPKQSNPSFYQYPDRLP